MRVDARRPDTTKNAAGTSGVCLDALTRDHLIARRVAWTTSFFGSVSVNTPFS